MIILKEIVALADKIKIFEEYIEKVKEPIKATTVYKGYNIGE